MLSVDTNNRAIIFNSRRCCQCGACLAVCPEGAISSEEGLYGLTVIRIDTRRCTYCGKCVSVCPASHLPLLALDEHVWASIKACGLAYHVNKTTRKIASSGGVARGLLSDCLESNRCDAVYTLMQRKDYPWAEGKLIKTDFDSKKVAGSMYLPVMALRNLRIDSGIETLAIVGTTCQLLAASRLLRGNVKRLIRIALLCKQQKHLGFTNFSAKRLGLRKKDAYDHISYRGQGWPGELTIDGHSLDFEQAAAIPFGKRLWRIPGCLTCINPFGYKPDITLADPWGLEDAQVEGKNIVIVWTKTGRDLVNDSPHIKFESSLEIEHIKNSIEWDKLLRKKELATFYLKGKASSRVMAAGYLERIQTILLESGLETVRLPNILYKLIAHLPDPLKLILTVESSK